MNKEQAISKSAAAAEIAKATKRSVRWVQLMASEGRFQKASRGQYDLLSVVSGLAALLDDQSQKAPKSEARERAHAARADELEMRLAERRRELIPQAEALEAMSLLVGKVNVEMSGLARRCTRDVDLQSKIEAEVNGSKARISDALAKLAGSVRDGGDAPAP